MNIYKLNPYQNLFTNCHTIFLMVSVYLMQKPPGTTYWHMPRRYDNLFGIHGSHTPYMYLMWWASLDFYPIKSSSAQAWLLRKNLCFNLKTNLWHFQETHSKKEHMKVKKNYLVLLKICVFEPSFNILFLPHFYIPWGTSWENPRPIFLGYGFLPLIIKLRFTLLQAVTKIISMK